MPGQLNDLKGANDPADVMRIDALRRDRVQLAEPIMQAAPSQRSQRFFLEAGPHDGVRTRELDDIQ